MVDRVTPGYEDRIEMFVYRDVNSDQEASFFARDKSIRVIPTMVFVDGQGQEVNRVVGTMSEDQLKQELDALAKR